MKRITQYDGLYGELVSRPTNEYIFSELIETRSPAFDWVIRPHIHARLFQVFCIESGEVAFLGPGQPQTLHGPCILLIPPTVLHGFTYAPTVRGRILTLSDTVLEGLFPATSDVLLSLADFQRLNIFDTDYPFGAVTDILAQIDRELFADLPGKQSLIRAYLTQLLVLLHRIGQFGADQQKTAETSALALFRRFQKVVKQGDYQKTIPEYAGELGISPVHLNRVCQTVMAKPALRLVQEQQIQEARNYLTYTTYSVSEIAYLLKFEYPNYFARLFKKHTGLSPKEYRLLSPHYAA